MTSSSHGSAQSPRRTDPRGATPYHSPITQPSPTGRPLPDQTALTWYFVPTLDRRRRPRTVSTTCAMWYPVRDPGSEPERLLVRRSGIAGCWVVSHSRPRPSHVSRNLTQPGKAGGPIHPRLGPSGTADGLVDRVLASRFQCDVKSLSCSGSCKERSRLPRPVTDGRSPASGASAVTRGC